MHRHRLFDVQIEPVASHDPPLPHPQSPPAQWSMTPETLNLLHSLPQEPQLLSSLLMSVSHAVPPQVA
jgi:hypothetical protein